MEPNLRDTPLRRFNTFWWGLGLFSVFAIAAFGVRLFTSDEPSEVDLLAGKERIENRRAITAEQLAERDAYKDLGEGKVQVKPSDVFGLAKEMKLLEGPTASKAPHNRKFD